MLSNLLKITQLESVEMGNIFQILFLNLEVYTLNRYTDYSQPWMYIRNTR